MKENSQIFYFMYEGSYKISPNRLNQKDYSGLLLKFTDESGNSGYASYHALEAFEDLKAMAMVSDLRKNGPESQLIRNYLNQDLQSRKLEMDTLAGSYLIENHKLLIDFIPLDQKALNVFIDEGFKIFKLKLGKNLELESEWIEKQIPYFQRHKIRLRLDFNGALEPRTFTLWCKRYNFHQQGIIDYYEDPCIYIEEQWVEWKQQGLCLAKDLIENNCVGKTEFPGVQVLVLKPAKLNTVEWLKSLKNPNDYKYVVTHYMDSPLGIAQAVASALKLKFFVKEKLITCGLLPVDQLQAPLIPEVFEKHINTSGPHLMMSAGLGLGFEKEMKRVDWKAL